MYKMNIQYEGFNYKQTLKRVVLKKRNSND